MRLLIIEDDLELSSEMKIGLEKQGFTIDIANTGIDGEEKAYITDYDAVLLDLNLPDKDGMEILSFLRGNERNIPVLIVSARDKVSDRTKGLDLGADDYIVKPFDFAELTFRVHAVIRRFYGRTNPNIVIGSLSVSPSTRIAAWEDKPIVLSAKEFDILAYLAQRYPEVVSGEQIMEHIYDEDFDLFSSVLRVHLSNLRKKLQSASGFHLLVTMKGKGYCLCKTTDE